MSILEYKMLESSSNSFETKVPIYSELSDCRVFPLIARSSTLLGSTVLAADSDSMRESIQHQR